MLGKEAECSVQQLRLGRHREERERAKGREDPGLKPACDTKPSDLEESNQKNQCGRPFHLDFRIEIKITKFRIFFVEKYLQNTCLRFLLTVLDYNE